MKMSARLRAWFNPAGFAVLCITVTGCSDKPSAPPQVPAEAPQLYINQFGNQVQTEITLNDEPIYAGSGIFVLTWIGFPMANGTNVLKYTVRPFPSTFDAKSVRSHVVMSFKDDRESVAIEDKSISLSVGEKVVGESRFIIQTRWTPTNTFQVLPTNQTSEAEVATLALHVATAFSSRSLQRIALTLEGISTNELYKSLPSWFFGGDAGISIAAISNGNQVAVSVGKHFAMAVRSDVSEDTNAAALFLCEAIGRKTTFKIQCLQFAKQDGRWCLIGPQQTAHPIRTQ